MGKTINNSIKHKRTSRRINQPDKMVNKKIKLITITLFIFISMFSIVSAEIEIIPNIPSHLLNGQETNYYGIKYSNNSNILMNGKNFFLCEWKDSQINKKHCVYEIEVQNHNTIKALINNYQINTNFTTNTISNISYYYSNTYITGVYEINNVTGFNRNFYSSYVPMPSLINTAQPFSIKIEYDDDLYVEIILI